MSHTLTPDIEAQTLALLAMRILSNRSGYPFTTVNFEHTLSEAYECLQMTRKFLEKKEEEESAKDKAYWDSEEGRKRREEAKARFEEFKKRGKR